MTLENKIKKIHKLNCEMFPENATLSMDAIRRLVAQAVEELGEVHGAARSYFGRKYSPKKTATLNHLSEEVGDCATMILLIGHLFGISLEDSLDRVIQKLEYLKIKKSEEVRIEHIMEQDMKYTNSHQPFKYDVEDPINAGVGIFGDGPYDRPA
jgi:NTP pyrophosphatase (non-canonical NTP hydrolase)